MQLTNNFQLKEFVENKWATPEEQKRIEESLTADVQCNLLELAKNLQVISDSLGNIPIIINIGFRPLWWELKKKRSGKSQHVLGKAADIKISGITPKQVFDKIEELTEQGKMEPGGLHAYKTFVHYDIRGHKARW